MDNFPEPNYESNQPPAWQWLLIVVVALVALCGIAVFLAGGYFVTSDFFAAREERATQTAAEATAVVQEQYALIAAAKDWPLLLSDSFAENANQWHEGEFDDAYARINFTVDGSYIWKMRSKQSVLWRVWPRSDIVDDFYLAVEAWNISDNPSAQYGLIFRNNDGSYFYFEVRDTQIFRVSSFYQNAWIDLIEFTESDAIQPGETNRLEVIAQGEKFTFLINGQLVGETTGSYPSVGQAGLAVGLDYADQETTIVFDNFELRGNSVEQ